jgi:DNA repair protein RecN (Recombination protein N)
MLESLTINNIVLIDKLDIQLRRGLCVLTGETGSGKSILLDAIGLALGYRSNSRLLRTGEEKGSVVAIFNIASNERAKNILKENDIDYESSIIIRRMLYDDGHSKAFINDTPVGQGLLQSFGETLLEIHGQNEQIGLLNSSVHREILDQYSGLVGKRKNVSDIYEKMKTAKDKLSELITKRDNLLKEQDYINHIVNEIEALNIQPNEEIELSDKRIMLMNKEKVLTVLKDVRDILEGQFNVGKNISSAVHTVARANSLGENLLGDGKNAFSDVLEDLEQCNMHLNEANYKIERIYNNLGFDTNTLEQVEDRLFAIRGLARKLNVQPELLNDVLNEMRKKLDLLNNQEIFMGNLEIELSELRSQFLREAQELSTLRRQASKKLAFELIEELTPLKMEKTVFDTEFKDLSEENWNKYGIDGVKFIASTNPGMPMDDLSKIASGGELSRFMLALKVVLSQIQSTPTLIFDEIDTGIGGAVADAVGERLKKLGNNLQVLVVTHHAQVASKGNYHLRVSKDQQNDKTNTTIAVLEGEDRIREIARMISGENISDEAVKVARGMVRGN